MLDRPRGQVAGWGGGCLAVFVLLLLGVELGWAWLAAIDDRGQALAEWSTTQPWLRLALRVVELAFGTVAMTVLSLALAGATWWRGHRRAALYTLAVMAVVSATTTVVKLAVGRERPPWQDPQWVFTSEAFPSGHASSVTALAGVALVLVTMLVRRRRDRRLLDALVLLVVVLVVLDRLLLGRHYPSDAAGGVALGAAVVLLGLGVLNPLPRSHALKVDPLPEVGPVGRRLAVVLNPSKVEDAGAFRSLVATMAAEADWSPPTWYLTTPEDPGTGQAEQAAVDGADLVVVCGGDGTVREVCAELAGTGVPVGIVPAGTGNLLARNLQLPLYLRAAVDVALTGQDRAVDMVAVGGDGLSDTHFLVMAGMGFDAAVMEGVNEEVKARVGWLAYVLSGLRAIRYPALRVEISVDGGDYFTARARTVLVGNVGFLQGGMPLLPDAVIDDGLLDVVLLHPRRFVSWIPLAVRVLTRWRRSDSLVHRMTGRTITIRTGHDAPRQLDGDTVGPGRELRMECIHGRLLVRVPR